MQDGTLVDEERVESPKSPARIKGICGQNGQMKSGEHEVPQPENVGDDLVVWEEEWLTFICIVALSSYMPLGFFVLFLFLYPYGGFCNYFERWGTF